MDDLRQILKAHPPHDHRAAKNIAVIVVALAVVMVGRRNHGLPARSVA
ncbi:hypothetical protein G5V59_19370 [Nocardioides sp. W3-2-3]|nr:hypothetical protein [Nocardioides convexus]NHA01281.1 hypothetical protein [Nocardioides convexus]